MSKIQVLCSEARAKGKKIGFANGCFDLLHDGHIHLLKEARKHCDVLVVGINSDESVRSLKGKDRPVDNKLVRFKKILDTRLADMVGTFDSESDLLSFIKEIKPDVLIKGADYHGMAIVGGGYVQKNGGKIVLIPLLQGFSTTKQIADKNKS